MPRDPGAVQRAMQQEANERKKDEAFIKKHGLDKPMPKKKKKKSSACGQDSCTQEYIRGYNK